MAEQGIRRLESVGALDESDDEGGSGISYL
jgi:hypothetical protein